MMNRLQRFIYETLFLLWMLNPASKYQRRLLGRAADLGMSMQARKQNTLKLRSSHNDYTERHAKGEVSVSTVFRPVIKKNILWHLVPQNGLRRQHI
jgi:hypothetical protein